MISTPKDQNRSAKLIYIASPYAGEVERNVEFAKDACRYCIAQGHTPVAVHLLYTQIFDDNDPAEREKGLRLGRQMLGHCDELWVCGDRISTGIAAEIDEAEALHLPIREISSDRIRLSQFRHQEQSCEPQIHMA